MNAETLNELSKAYERDFIQMVMVGLLINSPIVADFMHYSLAEAHRTYRPNLPNDAWSEFYDSRARVYTFLQDFSESTIKKMGNNTMRALVDSGYLSDSRTKHILPVYLMPSAKNLLVRLNRNDLIDLMECTV